MIRKELRQMTEHYPSIHERRRLVRKWQRQAYFRSKYRVIITCYFVLFIAGTVLFEVWKGLVGILDHMLLPSQ
jgi:hypothetical protein